jgi:predicted DNA-binding ribbon-helix-helix protein
MCFTALLTNAHNDCSSSLCDFCNAPEFFPRRHSATQISCSHVSNLLQQRGCLMKSPVVKRSIVVAGHKTSVSLEDAFWRGLKEIAGGRGMTLSELVGTIDSGRQHGNLSSAIRLFVLDFYRSQLSGPKDGREGTREMMAA